MRFLLDENVPRAGAKWLGGLGHDVLYVPDTDLRGQPDERLVKACNAENRIFVSFDLGLAVPPSELRTGLVLIRAPRSFTPTLICDLLAEAVALEIEGFITVTQPGRVRQRSLVKP